MTDLELESALRRVTRRSIAGILVVGAGTFAMGLFAALCGALRLDPDMRHYSALMWAAYGGMVCFFCAVGLLMAVSAVFVVPRRGRQFVERVMKRPETISRLWLILAKHKYNPADQPGQLGTSTSLAAQTVDDKHFQFMVPGDEAEALLQAIAARAPGAKIGPP